MPVPLKPPKGVSTLLKLGRSNAVPVNAQAARIVDAQRTVTKEKLTREIRQIRKKIAKAKDPIVRDQLAAEVRRLTALLVHGPTPRIDNAAIEKAHRELERAKWERENPLKRT